MRQLLRTALLAAPVAVAVLAVGPERTARADAAGDAALAKVDDAMNRAKTHQFEYDVTNQEAGKAETKLAMRVQMKGEKRLTEFLAPADMKGTKVLILSPDQMYVYLPAFGKVRRIASSVGDQGFMGMTFSQDDFVTKYTDSYAASVASDDGKQVRLVLTPKAGKTTPYAKIELAAPKDSFLPTEIKLFNAAGKHVKTETRSGYTCEGAICTAAEQKMEDHTKGAWTKMIRKSWKVNAELSDDVFSKRNLEK